MEPTEHQPVIFVNSQAPPGPPAQTKKKRTENAFFLFRREFRKTISEKGQHRVSELAGPAWRDLKNRGEAKPYEEMAQRLKEEQDRLFPGQKIERASKKGGEGKEPRKKRGRKPKKSVPAPTPSSSSVSPAPMHTYPIPTNQGPWMNNTSQWQADSYPAAGVSGNYLSHAPSTIQDSRHHAVNHAPAPPPVYQGPYSNPSTQYYSYQLPYVPTGDDLFENDDYVLVGCFSVTLIPPI